MVLNEHFFMREINAKSGGKLAYILAVISVLLVVASFFVYTQFFVHSPTTPKPVSDGFDYDELTQLVAAGDSEAMRKLGICFEFGFNVPRSRQEALRYYTLSSEAGNMSARYMLANMLISNRVNAAADEEKGLLLLVDLASMGNESAQLSLVFYYRNKEDKSDNRTHLKEAYVWANLLLGGMGIRKKSDAVKYLGSRGDYYDVTFEEVERMRGLIEVLLFKDEITLAQKRSFELFKTIKDNKSKK